MTCRSSIPGMPTRPGSTTTGWAARITSAARTLDFGAPVALMLLIILHLIPDDDDPYGIVAELMGALPSGSYLVLAHPASDIRAAQMGTLSPPLVTAWCGVARKR